jgi:hypothetical protein
MTDWYPDEELRELANLPRGAAARQEMEARLAAIEPVEREYWLGYLHLTDRLYADLARVEIPAGFEERLLRVADEAPAATRWPAAQRRETMRSRPPAGRWLNWRWAAAFVLIALAGRNVWVWYSSLPAEPKPLAAEVAAVITDQAVDSLESHRELDVSGGDAGAVRDALAARGLPFAPMILHPRQHADLLGGGVVDFHGTPAAYTRWQADGMTYTVYQFDGTKLGVPAVFAVADRTPKEKWHDAEHYRVVIWPGKEIPGKAGSCTWAEVSESDGAQDLFGGLTY